MSSGARKKSAMMLIILIINTATKFDFYTIGTTRRCRQYRPRPLRNDVMGTVVLIKLYISSFLIHSENVLHINLRRMT